MPSTHDPKVPAWPPRSAPRLFVEEVLVGGELRSRKGLNLPGIDLGISAFTDHDRRCLQFALTHGVDAVSQSFVDRAEDILAVRSAAADIGYKSICAPANLKMYYEAHKEHGSLPWSRIVEPAIAWAESGWTVRPHVHYWWSDDGAFGRAPNFERTGFTPAARALYCRPDGTPKRVGDKVVNRDYGQTLRAIAKGEAEINQHHPFRRAGEGLPHLRQRFAEEIEALPVDQLEG